MGLAAGQARLLTITGRKSDCEFESMRLSHQKIALARDLADLSNEYQNSLNQTKLVYDYYGTGDTSTPLTYNILMQPSALNDYIPTTITDSMGRVTLNNKLASAAYAAGIPQEGLGTLPSETMRNAFITALGNIGFISPTLAKTITSLPYNQAVGFGGGTTIASITDGGNYEDLVKYLKDTGSAFILDSTTFPKRTGLTTNREDDCEDIHIVQVDSEGVKDGHFDGTFTSTSFTFGDLLEGKTNYYLGYEGLRGEQSPVYGVILMQDVILGDFMTWMCDELNNTLNLGDVYTTNAIEYAKNAVTNLIFKDDIIADQMNGHDYWWFHEPHDEIEEVTEWGDTAVSTFLQPISGKIYPASSYDEEYQQWMVTESKDYMGFEVLGSSGGSMWTADRNDHTTGGINLNNIAQAFLTYFADYMNGVSKTDAYGKEVFDVNIGALSGSHLAKDNLSFEYTWKVGSEVSSDDLGQATFYDSLFNQICTNGWTENDQVNDKEYLKQMLQSGRLYISKMKDDGYYYQGNYSTDSYIKEIADESAIAAAEAKYNTEKAKLNAKEQTIDLKMKNLDTEITALTTEYDSVKNTISKQIEKSFKRYSA